MENMEMMTTFWKGKRVLLTGHTGFKGSWLAVWLQILGAEVTGYALPPATEPCLFKLADIAKGINSVIGDVRDLDHLKRTISDCRPEVVIHMAAQALVRYSYENPLETYQVNVMGTANVLEAVRQSDTVGAVLVVTSDKCYENREWVWGYRENEALGGHDPYSSSKACAELVAAAYRKSYFGANAGTGCAIPLASARAGNVIGGGDWSEDRLIPDIMRSIAASKPVKIRNPGAIRPWQHVLEPLSGYLLLAEKLLVSGDTYAQAWNFGPEPSDARTVEWISERITSLWGEGSNWIAEGGTHPHEARFLMLDCSKSVHQLGWKSRWTLNTALEQIVSWHRLHRDGANMRSVTEGQIKDYLKSA
jgi:CDP-glucose 4,6-dehydratase